VIELVVVAQVRLRLRGKPLARQDKARWQPVEDPRPGRGVPTWSS